MHKLILQKRARKGKTGITFSAFDLPHVGHMRMLKEAKTVCDHLIVCVEVDPSRTPKNYRGKKKPPPVMSIEERLEILQGIEYIDEIHVYDNENEVRDLLLQLKPDIRIIGADWKGKQFTGWDLTQIELYFNTRNHSYSTTELRKRVYEAERLRIIGDIETVVGD